MRLKRIEVLYQVFASSSFLHKNGLSEEKAKFDNFSKDSNFCDF